MSSSSGIGGGGGGVYVPPAGVPIDGNVDTEGVGPVDSTSGAQAAQEAHETGAPKGPSDSYSSGEVVGYGGPESTSSGMTPLEEDIATQVFTDNGIPNPFNGNTTPARERELRGDPAYGEAVSAGQKLLSDSSSVHQAEFLAAAKRLPQDGNIMETLLLVIKGSIQEANEDKKYYLRKLKNFNKISEALSDQLSDLADASSKLADKEKHTKHPNKKSVGIDMTLYDTKTVGPDGEPIETKHITESVTRQSLGTRMKEIEGAQEEVRNNRQEAQTAYQSVDQKVNQLYQIMGQVSKTMNEKRGASVKNML